MVIYTITRPMPWSQSIVKLGAAQKNYMRHASAIAIAIAQLNLVPWLNSLFFMAELVLLLQLS